MNAPYQPKDLTGSLFKNDRKESDTHPDYKGNALLNGVDHWVDAWINTSKNGDKYMSLKFKPKDQQGRPAPVSQGYAPAQSDLDDDVPF